MAAVAKPRKVITPRRGMSRRYVPYPAQEDCWNSTAQLIGAISGHYGGKSHLGANWLFREIRRFPGADFIVCGPTYNTLEKSAIPKIQSICNVFGLPWEYNMATGIGYRAGKRQYVLPKGGKIFFATADRPGSMQGAHVKGFWMDETVDTSYYVFETLLGRIMGENGRGIITSTPYDMGWLYENIYLRWIADGRPGPLEAKEIFVHQWKSIENPAFPMENWNRLKKQFKPWRFRMLYEGEFERPVGLVYDCFLERHWMEPAGIPQGSKIIMGMDFGMTDPTAAIWLAKSPENQGIFAVDEFYRSGWKANDDDDDDAFSGAMAMPTEMIEEIVRRSKERNIIPHAVYCDPSRPEYVEHARREFAKIGCFKVYKADNSIIPGIDRCYALVRSGKFHAFDTLTYFKDELAKYQWELTEEGEPIKRGKKQGEKAEPKDINNHLMDAWRYALAGSKDEPVNSFGFGRIGGSPDPFSGMIGRN